MGLPPVRVGGPVLWCLAVAGSIYVGLAAYEVRRDVDDFKQGRLGWVSKSSPDTYADLDAAKAFAARRRNSHPQERVFTEPEKIIFGTIGFNTGVFGVSSVAPALGLHFSHLPIGNANYTLFTSMFGHAGLWHLGLNMYGLYNFGPPVARTRTFENSGSHFAAFYLASGVLASLAHHLSSVWPSPADRFKRGLGASGAIMALLGAFAMSYPDAGIGIILIPGSLPAQQALGILAAFETYGLFVGFKSLPFAHSAHLAGLAIGSAYVYFDGKSNMWKPTRRFAFNQMRRLKMV